MKRSTTFLSLLVLLICLVVFLVYGWTWYCTVTNRPGILSQWYAFIGLSKNQFALYNFTGALIALVFVVLQIIGLIRKRERFVRHTFWGFLLFFCVLCCFEVYFQLRFIPKG